MKVLHINTSSTGGAALCAIRIANALRQIGVDTSMLLAEGEPKECIVIASPDEPSKPLTNWLACRVRNLIWRLRLSDSSEALSAWYRQIRSISDIQHPFFTIPRTSFKNIVNHPLVQEADIIHLHWIGNFIDYPTFFAGIDKPIVWTLHDENAGLGGYHYEYEKRLQNADYRRLESKCLKIKRKAYSRIRKMHTVAISSKMRDYISASPMLGKFPCVMIHNGVDVDVFQMCDKSEARKKLGIDAMSRVLLFSSFIIQDERKGLNELIEAVNALSPDEKENIVILCVGQDNGLRIKDCDCPVIKLGYIADTCKLSEYYSAADYFVLPSFQEAFAQTPLEAMSCGTPVVAFPCSGTKDLINNDNGIIASDFSAASLTAAFRLAFANHYDRNDIRSYIVNNFSYTTIADKYKSLYETVYNNN